VLTDDASPSWAAWNVIADVTGIGRGTRVLDVGCGSGRFCRLAAERGAVVRGVDAIADRIAGARLRLPTGDFRLGFMEELPWPADSFDVVTGFNAFQYAVDVRVA
jgi:ubiquinone/menaquinone biosynthesis C-methylase UbiE